MMKKLAHIVQSILVITILTLGGMSAVFAATTSIMTTSFTIRQPTHPLTPVLYSMPTSEICNTLLNVNGKAESNVDIYLNGTYKTTSALSDGSFSLTLFLEKGTNTFEVKSKRGDDFSPPVTYTVENNFDCLPQGPSSSAAAAPKVALKEVADHLETHEVDEYIEDTLTVEDESLEPLTEETEESDTSGDTNTEPDTNPFEDAVEHGVETTYDDFDRDGISDAIEEVMGLDIYTDDSDKDGIADIHEITVEQTIEKEEYELSINITEDQVFSCDDILLHGSIEYTQTIEPDVTFCLEGNNGEECYDISLQNDGSFVEHVVPHLQEGKYNAHIKVNREVAEEFPINCVTAETLPNVLISQIDLQKVYQNIEGRYIPRTQLFSLRSQPIARGTGANHDMVFAFWVQAKEEIARSIAMSDINGYFQVQPHRKLKSFLGFGKAELFVYGLDEGTFGQVDRKTFYIFDLLLILMELALLILGHKIYKNYRTRKKFVHIKKRHKKNTR